MNIEINNIKTNIERLKENIEKIKNRYGIKYPIEIVCVSKTHPVEKIIEAYKTGLKIFGENRVQEGSKKIENLLELNYKDIKWHMIGHLQTNKVKYAIKYFDVIQSVDREKLVDTILKELNKNEEKNKIDIMIEVNTSLEIQKSGVKPDNYFKLLDYILERGNNKLNVVGLMTVGPLTDNKNQISRSFQLLYDLFNQTKDRYSNANIHYLSMGMSNDYELAIAHGSNMIRIGSAIFGKREY